MPFVLEITKLNRQNDWFKSSDDTLRRYFVFSKKFFFNPNDSFFLNQQNIKLVFV